MIQTAGETLLDHVQAVCALHTTGDLGRPCLTAAAVAPLWPASFQHAPALSRLTAGSAFPEEFEHCNSNTGMRTAVELSDLAMSHSKTLLALLLSSRWHNALKPLLVSFVGRPAARPLPAHSRCVCLLLKDACRTCPDRLPKFSKQSDCFFPLLIIILSCRLAEAQGQDCDRVEPHQGGHQLRLRPPRPAGPLPLRAGAALPGHHRHNEQRK